MIALITGDLVNSASVDPQKWMPMLKQFFELMGQSPKDWEIYRGDSFQFKCKPTEGFQKFLQLKSIVKQYAELDVRVSIGIGKIAYESEKITESNGPAFVRSGRTFDDMKGKEFLAFSTGSEQVDKPLNLLARFASLVMDNWSPTSAETVKTILENPGWNQQQIAEKLQINQSAVSQNRKRAQFDLLMDFNEYYITAVTSLTS